MLLNDRPGTKALEPVRALGSGVTHLWRNTGVIFDDDGTGVPGVLNVPTLCGALLRAPVVVMVKYRKVCVRCERLRG